MRVPATLAAAIVGAVAFAIAGIAPVTVLQAALTSNTDATLELRTDEFVALIDGGTPAESASIASEQGELVQLIGQTG